MQIGARTGAWSGGAKMPTARDYVQDGLIAMWDGIENARWGVHDSQKRCVDLVGNCGQISLVSGTVDESFNGGFLATSDCVFHNDDMAFINSEIAEGLKDENAKGFTIISLIDTKDIVDRTRGVQACVIENWKERVRPAFRNRYQLFVSPNMHRLVVAYAGDATGNEDDDYTEPDIGFFGSRIQYLKRGWIKRRSSGDIEVATLSNVELYSGWLTNYQSYVSRWIYGATLDISIKNGVKLYKMMVYNRLLSIDEMQEIYAIDKARFGLT